MTDSASIDFSIRAGARYAPFLKRMIPRAAGAVPNGPQDVSVALVGDAKMAELHVRFMNIPGPTDVLTFELDHDPRGRVTAGEIVVCVGEARRQAKLHGTRVEHELLLYVVHGLLHLTGHDDHEESAYRRMHAAEDRILRKLGIGPVFKPVRPVEAAAARRTSSSKRTKKKEA